MSNAKQKAQQELAKTQQSQQVTTFKKMVASQMKSISAALPRHMDPMRMMRVIVTAAEKNPKLFECTALSLQKCIVEVSQMGLEPDGVRGHAYLIPYYNNRESRYECSLQLGYKGMIELALRSGKVASVHAELVYEGEHFEWEEGTSAKLVHKPKLDLDDNAKVLCAYAVATLFGGGSVHAVLRLRDIEKRRAVSKTTRKDSPWHTHWEAMAKKSAIRALANVLPQSPELQRAAVVDEAREERPDAIEASFDLVMGGEGEKPLPGGGAQGPESVDAETGEVLSKEEAYVAAGPEREPGEEG